MVYRGIVDIIIDTALYMTIILHRRGRQQELITTHAQTQTLSSRAYSLRHCNARGCEYGWRETTLQCCANAGPPRHWRHRLGVLWRCVPRSRLSPLMLYPASFSKAITSRV